MRVSGGKEPDKAPLLSAIREYSRAVFCRHWSQSPAAWDILSLVHLLASLEETAATNQVIGVVMHVFKNIFLHTKHVHLSTGQLVSLSSYLHLVAFGVAGYWGVFMFYQNSFAYC